jgi:hypothetical protein
MCKRTGAGSIVATMFFPHFVGDACTIAVIPDRID